MIELISKIIQSILGEKDLPKKHYIYLTYWGGSMFLACIPAFGFLWGLLFLFVFFLLTTYKHLAKLVIFLILVAIVSYVIPYFAFFIASLSFVFLLLKINYLRKNWRALRVGVFAYFGYIIIMSLGQFVPVVGMFIGAIIFTVIFHKMLQSLYQAGYNVDKAFTIIGMTPLIILSVMLPFLKIDIEGIEIFHGSFSDQVGIYSFHGHVIPEGALPTEVKLFMKANGVTIGDLIKLTGFDINDIISISNLSHAMEASFAASAAYGVFKISSRENELSIRNEDGTVEIISPVDDKYSVIKNNHGENIGTIFFDKEKGLETVILSNGFTYSIEQSTGNVINGEGKILGKITDDGKGNKILSDENGNVKRTFQADGTIFDQNNNEIGCAAV